MSGNGSGKPGATTDPRWASKRARLDQRSASDAEQTASDADQTASDADQTASERDDAGAASDQVASDEDQKVADREHQQGGEGDDAVYEASRQVREAGTLDRLASHVDRAATARERGVTADTRDVTSTERDARARLRDERAEEWDRANASSGMPIRDRFQELRARAAADRRRAAEDRAAAAIERAELEAELHSAHLDHLTGAYRREMGMLALQHELDRAVRANGQFVVAFIDVDGMKEVNDRDGHAAGDHVLQTLVWTMRSNLRSFDPVLRFGGDEFIAGLGGLGVEEATRRFGAIEQSVEREVGVGFSIGLAELEPDETLQSLMKRADSRLLIAKGRSGS